MTNALIDNILNNLKIEDLKKLVGTKELRTFSGKKFKEFNNDEMMYLSVRKFSSYSDLILHSGVLTSYLHNTIPTCCIVRMTENVSYILLKIENDKIKIVNQNELNQDQLKMYRGRSK